MSSDSEDDCYGNIAQKLNSIKSKYTDDKIKTTNILGDSSTNTVSLISSQNVEKPAVIDLASAVSGPTEDFNSTFNSLDGDDNILDQIIATNTKKRGRKSKAITSDISASNILPERASRRKRGKTATATPDVSQNISINDTNKSIETPNLSLNESVLSDSSVSTVNSTRGRRGAKRGRRGRGAAANSPQTQPPVPTSVAAPTNPTNTTVNSPSASSITNTTLNTSRGSRRGRGRGTTTPRRPRQRRRNYGWFSSRRYNPFTSIFDEDDEDPSIQAALLSALARPLTNLNTPAARQPTSSNTPNYPTYSVGNTYEYPDESHGQQLFQNKPAPSKDVEVIENNEDTEMDNEELSVKVYWQNLEYVKFNIRKYQKLSKIFDHFAQKENVTHDKLFLTYNDRILKSTDTPDSIGYNIAKFIDGGIIKQNVSQLVKDTGEIKDGITLKFQCQAKKTPFITNIKKDEKLSVAMMKCAENLEQPVSKLKFYFDGDLLSGKSTAEELELEGGECIDVKIIS